MDADKVLECLIKTKEGRETDHPIVIQMITCHHTLEYAKYTQYNGNDSTDQFPCFHNNKIPFLKYIYNLKMGIIDMFAVYINGE